jgi:hypothetical protein
MSSNNSAYAEAILRGTLKVDCRLEMTDAGIAVTAAFSNLPDSSSASDLEIWVPITGNLTYLHPVDESLRAVFLDDLHDLGDFANNSKFWNLYLKPGDLTEFRFDSRIDLEKAGRMREIAERDGVIRIVLNLSFVALPNAGASDSAPLAYRPVLNFNIPKSLMETWVTRWTDFHAEMTNPGFSSGN